MKVDLVAPPAVDEALFAEDVGTAAPVDQPVGRPVVRVSSPRVVATSSRLLFDILAVVYEDLGFGVVGDETFRDLVIARIVEPTSILDTSRVLDDLGQRPASEKTMRRTLRRCVDRGYRDQIATACFAHALAAGDVSLVLYDVTTLYFEAEKEDDLRKVGYSKERRVDPQIVVGLLVDRNGFPLEIGCYEGNKAETATIIPIVKQFAEAPIRRVAEVLTHLNRPREQVIFGKVRALESADDEPGGRVVVDAAIDGRVRPVLMVLNAEHYRIAVQCHKKRAVVVQGLLDLSPGQQATMAVSHFAADESVLLEVPRI